MSQPTTVPRTIDYASKAPRNPAATKSLVLGLLFFVFPFVPGFMAMKFGRRGIRQAAEVGVGGRLARAGIVLGVVNWVLSVVFMVVAPVVISRAIETARRETCASHLRAIGGAVLIYSNENRGHWPPSLDRLNAAGYISDPYTLLCPSCANDPKKGLAAVGGFGRTNYHVTLPILPSSRFQNYMDLLTSVLAYEPLANHDGAGAHFLFVDGHVEWLDAPAAQKLIAETLALHAAGVEEK